MVNRFELLSNQPKGKQCLICSTIELYHSICFDLQFLSLQALMYSLLSQTYCLAHIYCRHRRCELLSQSDPLNAVFSLPSASGNYFNLYVLSVLLIFELSASYKQVTDGSKENVKMSMYSSLGVLTATQCY